MARGNANGRGSYPYRGGKFRGNNSTSARGRGGRGGARGGYPNASSTLLDEGLDFTVQMYANATLDSRPATPGRGRGNQTPRGKSTPRGRGTPGHNTPDRGRGRGRGFTPKGKRVEGIGASSYSQAGPSRAVNTLSSLLYQERPFLKPISFVPSVHSKVLFQENDDELLKPAVEDVDETEESHVPTADRIAQLFSGALPDFGSNDNAASDDQEEIEEVDFNEVGKLFDPTSTVTKTTKIVKAQSNAHEEQFTGVFAQTTIAATTIQADEVDVADLAKELEERLSTTEDGPPMAVDSDQLAHAPPERLFFVDTQKPPSSLQPPVSLPDDDDEIIVYVAPHPRHATPAISANEPQPQHLTKPDTSLFTPYTPIASIASISVPEASTSTPITSSVSFSFTKTEQNGGSSTPARLVAPPITTPRNAKLWQHKVARASSKKNKTKNSKAKGKNNRGTFGSFGLMREEALLAAALDGNTDLRYDERRRGDSDLDWGDTDDDKDENARGAQGGDLDMQRLLGMLQGQSSNAKGKAKASQDDHGMDVDPDLDISAMQSFVGGMLGRNAGQHTTMDDLKDEEVMKLEDEAVDERGSSGEEEEEDLDDNEVDNVLKNEEALLMSEVNEGLVGPELLDESDDEEDDDDEDDEDDDKTPRAGFQARLDRLRARTTNTKVRDDSDGEEGDDDDEDDMDDYFENFLTKGEQDNAFMDDIEDILIQNRAVMESMGLNRKKFYSPMLDSDDELEGFSSPIKRRKDKGKGLSPDLQVQWEKDRKKKAEYKRERDLAKLIAAADPLTRKKGGKKARRTIQRAAGLDPTIHVIPNRVIDLTTLIQQIRRFIEDVGGPSSMSLPPTNKETRKNVHELAIAFNLKSVSKGKGDARYTTLAKTTRTGTMIDERKIGKIVRRGGGAGAPGNEFIYDKGRKGGPMPKHKEGDEVGGAAPKINDSNVGFRLLEMMGWSEGDRIGSSMKGLDVPLTAIIKTTKRGLGAS